MGDPAILETLSRLPHFKLLEPALVERLAEGSFLRIHAAGDLIFNEGDVCRGFFAVRRGSVRIQRLSAAGREHVLHTMHEGQSFAEAALLSIGRYPASAVALETPTELVEIGGQPFLRLFREDERLAAAMVGSLCARMISLVERVEELSILHAAPRLARYLLRQPGHGSSAQLRIDLPMPKKDLAAHLSMTPETLSRLLRRWQDEGLIAIEGGSITLLDDRRLQLLADGDDASPAARTPET